MNPPKIVQAAVNCGNMITKGKKYEVIGIWSESTIKGNGFGFDILNDAGLLANCKERNCAWQNYGNWIIVEREADPTAEPTQNANDSTEEEAERLRNAAPEMLAALNDAQKLLSQIRKYLPKSIKNTDKFDFENVNATIGKAIQKATNP